MSTKLPGRRCPMCGHQSPSREVADDEVCACGSRMCVLSSGEMCITTNKPRAGTFRREEAAVKAMDAPPRNRMLSAPGVRK